MQRLALTKKETIKRWDYISTFKPPANLSIENGRIFKVDKLNEGAHEYSYVTDLFLSTWGGIQPNINAYFGMNRPYKGKKPVRFALP